MILYQIVMKDANARKELIFLMDGIAESLAVRDYKILNRALRRRFVIYLGVSNDH